MAAAHPRRRRRPHAGRESRARVDPGRPRGARGATRPRAGPERDAVQRQRAAGGRAGAQGTRARARTAGDGARLRHRLHRRRAARVRERRPSRPDRRHCGVGDRASGGRGAAGARRDGNLARNRGGRPRPVGFGRRSEHPGRHRPPCLGPRNRTPDPRLEAARPANRAYCLRAGRGVGQALHRGGVRGGRDRGPAGRAGHGPDDQGRGRARGRMPDRARLRRRGDCPERSGAARARAPRAAWSVLRRHAGDGGARGARGGGDSAPSPAPLPPLRPARTRRTW